MPAKYPETERSDDVSIDVCALPSDVHAVTIAASVEGTTFGEVGELVWLVLLETGEIATSFAVQGMTTERALVLGELYRRGETWRLRAIGQGWDGGLAGRATDFGIDVAGDEPETDGQGDVPEEFAISEAESLVDPAADFTGGPTQSQGATRASTALTEAQTPPTTGAGYVSEPVVNDAVNDESTTTAIDPATRTPDCTGVINRPPSAPGSTRVRTRPTKTKPVTAPVMTLGDDPSWGPARLFSVSGIGGVDEQEKRATSALLWVMSAVRPLIPDGVIRIARGGKVWTALVEVKTGDAALERTQIENYVRLANRRKFDVMLTVSNQISTDPELHPIELPSNVMKSVSLIHLSWSEVMHEIRMLLSHHEFSDPLQVWILAELLKYLENPRGPVAFHDMGVAWVAAREAVAAGTLRPEDRTTGPVVTSWNRLVRQLSLGLRARLGVSVKQSLPRRLIGGCAGRRCQRVSRGIRTGLKPMNPALTPADAGTHRRRRPTARQT